MSTPAAGADTADIGSILGERFTNRGRIFGPTPEYYDCFDSVQGLRKATLELFQWLGYKPASLQVGYAGEHASAGSSAVYNFLVPSVYRHQAYQAAAWLALEVLTQVIARNTGRTPDGTTVELASIETGLGLLVLNGITAKPPLAHRLYHLVHNHRYGNISALQLIGMSPGAYATRLASFFRSFHIEPAVYLPAMTEQSWRVLGVKQTKQVDSLPAYASWQRQRRNVRRWWLKLTLASLACAMLAALAVFVTSQRPYRPSTEVLNRYNELAALKLEYDACVKRVNDMPVSLSADIYQEQRRNAALAECASLRNRYDYAVSQYNRLVAD